MKKRNQLVLQYLKFTNFIKKLNQTINEVNDKNLIDHYMTKAANDMQDDGNFYTKYKSFLSKDYKTQF